MHYLTHGHSAPSACQDGYLSPPDAPTAKPVEHVMKAEDVNSEASLIRRWHFLFFVHQFFVQVLWRTGPQDLHKKLTFE
jgi:hypothetical protein